MLIPYTPAKLNDNSTSSDTSDDYYEIRTAEDLFWFAAQTNGLNNRVIGKLMNDINLNPDYTFIFEPDTGLVKMEKAGGTTVYLGTGIKGVIGDIDIFDTVASLKGCFYSSNTAIDITDEPKDLIKWTPIAESSNYCYSGTLDGCGNVIKNLYINNPSANNQGLIGNPDRANIFSLGLLDCNITGAQNVGGFIGNCQYTNVENCFVTGFVGGNENVGGIFGCASGASASNNISSARVSDANNVGVIAGSLMSSSFSDSIGLKDNNIPLLGSQDSNLVNNVVAFDDFSSGEACYYMNGNSSVYPKWFQNIGEGGDECPVLNGSHGVVYKTDSGFAMCSEHNGGDCFCSICGHYLSDGLEPNEDKVFEINDAKKLLWFSYYVEYTDNSVNAMLTADIDLSAVCGDGIGSWRPIGGSSVSYNGTFDGKNHTVRNLYMKNGSWDYSALFYATKKDAKITDIIIENADITCSFSAGILVGYNAGEISHCSVGGSISATANYLNVGGVCALNKLGGSISDCNSKATVSVNGNQNKVGGVCGRNISSNSEHSEVKKSINIGSVTAIGEGNKVGPVIGFDSNPTLSEVKNNYYLAASEIDSLEGTTFKTEDQLKSGEVVYLLNNGVTDGTQLWYQTCDVDYPEIKGATVYTFTNCKSEADYTNNSELVNTVGGHDYFNGICSACGEYMAAVYNADVYEIDNAGQLYWFAERVNSLKDNNIKGKLMTDININPSYTFTFDPDTGLVELKKNKEVKGFFGTGISGDASGKNTIFDTNASTKGDFYASSNSTDLSSKPQDLREWSPIGNSDNEYTGTFDGDGKSVSGLYVNNSSEKYVGLFGYIGINGTVKDITVTNLCILGNTYVGGVSGWNNGEISGCQNSGTVSGNDGVGGVSGWNYASIKNCANTGAVSGVSNVGGVCGCLSSGNIENCFNTGKVAQVNQENSAGVVGYKENGTISNCYFLDTSATYGMNADIEGENISPEGQAAKRTSAQFADGSVAWLLNTAGKGYAHSGIWAQGESCPVFANKTNLAIYKVGITGAITKAFYLKSGESFTMPENIYCSTYTAPVTVGTTDIAYTSETAITSAQPKLGSSITMIYEAHIKTALIGVDAPQMVFSYHEGTYNIEGVAGTPVGEYTPYSFAFTNITPQCMGDTIDVSLTLDGKTATKKGYSLKIYCDTLLAKSDTELSAMLASITNATVEELRALLSDILLYGAASQMFTEYKTDALIGNLETLKFDDSSLKTVKAFTGTKNDNAYFTATGLWFENINKIYWKIAVSDENASKLSVLVYRDGETTPCGTLPVKYSNGVYIVYSEDITASNFGTRYNAVITYDGALAQTASYSVNSYVYSMYKKSTPIGNLVKALYNYGESTIAYAAE